MLTGGSRTTRMIQDTFSELDLNDKGPLQHLTTAA